MHLKLLRMVCAASHTYACMVCPGRSFADAQEVCGMVDGHLASFKSPDEYNTIVERLVGQTEAGPNRAAAFWLGATAKVGPCAGLWCCMAMQQACWSDCLVAGASQWAGAWGCQKRDSTSAACYYRWHQQRWAGLAASSRLHQQAICHITALQPSDTNARSHPGLLPALPPQIGAKLANVRNQPIHPIMPIHDLSCPCCGPRRSAPGWPTSHT